MVVTISLCGLIELSRTWHRSIVLRDGSDHGKQKARDLEHAGESVRAVAAMKTTSVSPHKTRIGSYQT